MLLSSDDLTSETSASLKATDARAVHIRKYLSFAPRLRVGVEGRYIHDEATAILKPDGGVCVSLPSHGRRTATRANVVLVVAMQRPKVMARVLEAAAGLGVTGVIVVAAANVEKSYWECKLFREGEKPERGGEARQTGREGENASNEDGNYAARRQVDGLERVRNRLVTGVQQGAVDVSLPWVELRRDGISGAVACTDEVGGLSWGGRKDWKRVVAHPYGQHVCVTSVGPRGGENDGMVVAIGPEGGWTEMEVEELSRFGFVRVALGSRVLRSETAVVVALGLAHESLRIAQGEAEQHRLYQ